MRPVLVSKEALRTEIAQQTAEFLKRKQIEQVPTGLSAFAGLMGKDIPAHRFILQTEEYYHPLLTWQQMGRSL